MLKCTPEAVGLADKWIEQMALTGPTNMRAGLQDVVSYRMADCVYLVSDGRADNPLSVLEFIADQVRVSWSCWGWLTVPLFQRGSARTAKVLTAGLGRSSVPEDCLRAEAPGGVPRVEHPHPLHRCGV